MPKPISIGADCQIVEEIRRSRGRKAVYRGFLLPEKIPIIAKESPRHELIREVVCSLVAQSLGLPTPEPFLVQSPMPESRQDWRFATQQEAVSFAKVNFSEVKIAGLAKGWQGNPEFGECCRLLEDRIPFLPQVIDSALGLGEGQGAFRFDWS